MTPSPTPLDTIDIPDGVHFEIQYLRFAGNAGWIYSDLDDLDGARQYLAWAMRTTNVQWIVTSIGAPGIDVVARFDLIRRGPLQPWACPQMPEWENVIENRAAVVEAVRIVQAYQQRRTT